MKIKLVHSTMMENNLCWSESRLTADEIVLPGALELEDRRQDFLPRVADFVVTTGSGKIEVFWINGRSKMTV